MGCSYSVKSYWAFSFDIEKDNSGDNIDFVNYVSMSEAISYSNCILIDYLTNCTIYKKTDVDNKNYNNTLTVDIAICHKIKKRNVVVFFIEYNNTSAKVIQEILRGYINKTNIKKYISDVENRAAVRV